jgi:hypothetical protein
VDLAEKFGEVLRFVEHRGDDGECGSHGGNGTRDGAGVARRRTAI